MTYHHRSGSANMLEQPPTFTPTGVPEVDERLARRDAQDVEGRQRRQTERWRNARDILALLIVPGLLAGFIGWVIVSIRPAFASSATLVMMSVALSASAALQSSQRSTRGHTPLTGWRFGLGVLFCGWLSFFLGAAVV